MESPAERSTERTALIADVANILPGEFHLLDYLGEGGHGIVFKAIFKPLQSQVALKLIKQDDPERMVRELERMQNEARTLAKLQHPNIIKVYQLAKCDDGTPFLVCEYIQGKTLSSFIEDYGPLNINEIRSVFCQILDALRVSHEHGLIHRDIKPNNIMLSREKPNAAISVKVLDFGIARDLSEATATSGATTTSLGLTRTIQVTGSAPYMSPEQCKGAKIDPRTDLYSVACVLYECLAGRPPFIGETPIHTRYMHIHEQAKQPSDNTDEHLREKGSLYKLVLKALSKSPNDRPQSAEEFKNELMNACEASKFNTPDRKRPSPRRSSPLTQIDFKTIAFGSLLISMIIGSTYSFVLLGSKQHPEIDRPMQIRKENRAHKADLLDPLYQLGSARIDIDKTFKNEGEETFETRKLSVEAWEKIERAIPKIDKKDKGLLFAAWAMRGGLADPLDLPKEKVHSFEQALSYCVSDGKPTLEASQCYQQLASCMLVREDLAKAESYAKSALSLRQQNEKEELPLLQIPQIVDVRDKTTELTGPLLLLAEVYDKKGDLPNAIKYYKSAFDSQVKNYGPASAANIARANADILTKVSNAKAEQFMREYLQELCAAPDTNINQFGLVIDWCKKHGNQAFFEECADKFMETSLKNNLVPKALESEVYKIYLSGYRKRMKNKN